MAALPDQPPPTGAPTSEARAEIDEVRAFVASWVPELASHTILVCKDEDKLVIDVGDRLIVRVGRSDRALREMERERRLADTLQEHTELRLPLFVAADDRIDAYWKLPGEPLSATLYRSLPRPDRRRIGEQLAGFLVAIHDRVDRVPELGIALPPCERPLRAAALRERLLPLVAGELRMQAGRLIDSARRRSSPTAHPSSCTATCTAGTWPSRANPAG